MREFKLYLLDIRESIRKIYTYLAGMTFDQFVADAKTFDAVVRNMEIIGEATTHISRDIRTRHYSVDWQAIVGMRNIMAHEYFAVGSRIIWRMVERDLPELDQVADRILKEHR